MSAKDNFAQAFKELISGPGGPAEDNNATADKETQAAAPQQLISENEIPVEASPVQTSQAPTSAPAPSLAPEQPAKPRGFGGFGGFAGFGSSSTTPTAQSAQQTQSSSLSGFGTGSGTPNGGNPFNGYNAPAAATTIAQGTVVIGEIHSKGDINLYGEVKGNVETIGNVQLGGRVMGNIAGNDMVLEGSAVKGNVAADGSISLDSESVIMGDLKAKDGEFNGKIKGNLNVEGLAHFQGDTVLLGNVNVGALIIEQGARLRGEICTGSRDGFDINDPFQG